MLAGKAAPTGPAAGIGAGDTLIVVQIGQVIYQAVTSVPGWSGSSSI